jgi:hypothetical protein
MSDWKQRLTETLEPILGLPDPRVKLAAYDNLPYAIFHYPPEDELLLRKEVSLLQTRLEHAGKRIACISLADCLAQSLKAEGMGPAALAGAEKTTGLSQTTATLHSVLEEYRPLTEVVAARLPTPGDPTRDIFFILRAGALFPFYRTSALLEQMMGRTQVPGVLFYPGTFDGVTGLSFMGVHTHEPNYRPRIF